MTSTCPRFGKWIGGCRFEGRFDTPVDDGWRDAQFATWKVAPVLLGDGKGVLQPEPPTQKYIRDICIRCGKTVEREKQHL